MWVCRCGEALAERVEVEEGMWVRFCRCGRDWVETSTGLAEIYFGA